MPRAVMGCCAKCCLRSIYHHTHRDHYSQRFQGTSSGVDVIKLRISVIRTFLPDFRETENGSSYFRKLKYGNTEKNTELRIIYLFYGNTEFYKIEIIRKYGEFFCFTEIQKYRDFITFAPGKYS